MKKNESLLNIILTVILLLFINCTEKKEIFTSEVIKVNNGYGYKILANNKLLINQVTIPSINKNLAFCDSIDAQKISNIVVEKLKNKKHPIITTTIIENQNVKLDCIISY